MGVVEIKNPSDKSPFIVADNLGLKTPLGNPYLNITAEIPLGSFVAVTGEHDAGKTPLLLTLAGRMRFNQGSLTIAGHKLPKGGSKVRRIAGLGLFSGLNDLEQNLTVCSVAAADLELAKLPRRRSDVSKYLAEWDLGHVINTKIRNLSEPELVRLGIALGMVSSPKILAVDDVEHSLTHAQTHDLVEMLANMAHEREMIVIVALTEQCCAEGCDVLIKLERKK